MKNTFRFALILAVLVSFFNACKPDPVDPDPVTPVNPNPNPGPSIPTGNAIGISFEHFVDMDSMICDDVVRYINANGDSFSVDIYRYYISNISFTDNLGNTWYENESYHLIDAGDTNEMVIYIDSIPAGTYTSVNFMIGVDSARNVSGAQTGALDPANAMFWTWNSGYIMAKIEGHSPSSTASFNLMIYHIAGYGAPYPSQRWVSPSFGSSTANVTSGTVPMIHMKCDVSEWFKTPTIVDVSQLNVMNSPGNDAMMFADNYSDMFSVRSISN